MKTCLTIWAEWFGLDVAFNLVEFYKNWSFKTYFSEKLLDARFVVILRAVDQPMRYRGMIKIIRKFTFMIMEAGTWWLYRMYTFWKNLIFSPLLEKPYEII